MSVKNFEGMSVHELKYLIRSAQERIEELEAMEQLQTIEKIQDMARQAGLEVMLKPAKPKARKRNKATARYRNPTNPEQTWSGQGRKPKWAQEAIDAGKSLEDLAI